MSFIGLTSWPEEEEEEEEEGLIVILCDIMDRDTKVTKLPGYWLFHQDSILCKGREFLLCHNVLTGSRTHPSVLSNEYRKLFPQG